MKNYFKYSIVCSLLIAHCALGFAQDTARVEVISPATHLFLFNPMADFSAIQQPIKLDFAIDPLLQPAGNYNSDLYLRNLMAVDRVGQMTIGNLQKEQDRMRVNSIIGAAMAGFVWGMIIKENIEGYNNFKKQQKSGVPLNRPDRQPAAPPPGTRPPELKRQ